MEQNKNFDVAVNHKFFTNSLLKILEIVEKKSQEIIVATQESFDNGSQAEPDFKKTKKYKAHMKLQETCVTIRNGFVGDDENFDKGKIIKKIYKVLTQNLDKFYPTPDTSLFQIKNEKDEVVTIIPGLDINLIVKGKQTTPEDMNQLWGNMYMMYISATSMITSVNEHKKDGKVWEIIPKMREKVVEMGITQDGAFFNPFVGLNVETGEYDVNTMFANVENMQDPSGISMENMLQMSGMDKLFNMKELSKQLKDIKEEDINEATKNITKLIGADGDTEVNAVCDDLVKNVVAELQKNPDGNFNMFDIAKSVADRVGGRMKKDQMKKTAAHLDNFMNNSHENLKDLKDENGNPIGEKLMNTLNIPLQLAKMMGQQQNKGGKNNFARK
jgi:hypothetical protein